MDATQNRRGRSRREESPGVTRRGAAGGVPGRAREPRSPRVDRAAAGRAGAAIVCGLALGFILPASARAGARLEAARWTSAPAGPGSAIAIDGQVLTTTVAAVPIELVARGELRFDIAGGRETELQFLTSENWVGCLAPGGLVADATGRIAFECRANARGLAGIRRPIHVKVKIDPAGGGLHRNLGWDFRR